MAYRQDEFLQLAPLPMIDTPLSRVTEHWQTYQKGVCRDFEMDYIRCCGQVGFRRSKAECRKYYEDFAECAWQGKAMQRRTIIEKERKRKGLPHKPTPSKDSVETPLIH